MIAGDGIGREVIPAGLCAIEAAARGTDVTLSFTQFPWGCDFYKKHGRMMDEDGFERLAAFDAIYLGAVGAPGVPDHVSVWELILPLRQRFDQYVNLRPMRLLRGVASPLADRQVSREGIDSYLADEINNYNAFEDDQPPPASNARASLLFRACPDLCAMNVPID